MSKQYEMLFKLGAQLGTDFSGTFSSAQKILSQTQKEIQALNKEQNSIKAFEKQSNDVKKAQDAYNDYQAKLRNVREEMANAETVTASMKNAEIDLERAVSNAAMKLGEKQAKLDALGNELREAGINTEDLAGESKRLSDEMENLKEAEEKAAEEADEFGEKGASAFESVGSALVAAGILDGLKELASQYAECVTGAASFADEIGTVSVQYGMAAEELQAYYYAAELVDVSADTLTKSMAKNIKSMKAVQDGTKLSVEAYETLDVSVLNSDDTLRDSDEVYWEVIDALGKMTNETERDAIAQQILGRSAMELNTLIVSGSGVLKEYAAEAEAAGYVMSKKTLAACMAMDDEMQRSNSSMLAFKNTIGAAFTPELTAATKIWNQFLGGLTNFAQEHPEVTRAILAFVGAIGAATAAYVTYKGVVAAAKLAQDLLKISMKATPWGLVITGVAAATAAVVAFSTAEQETVTVNKMMSEKVSEAEKAYNEAAEAFGENSEEARRLRGEYEVLKLETEELAEAEKYLEENLQSQTDAFNAAKDEYDATLKAINEEEIASLALVDVLEELTSKSELTATEQERLGLVVDELNARYKDLGITIDETTGKASVSVERIRNAIRQDAEKKAFTEDQERYIDLEEKLPGLQEAEREAFRVLEAASNTYDDLYKRSKLYDEYTYLTEAEFRNAHPEYNNMGWDELGSHLAVTPGEVENARKATETARQNLITAAEPLNEALKEMAEIDERSAEYEQKHKETSDELIDTIKDLSEAYTEAYEAAYKSIVGQYELWDTAAVVIPKDIDDISTAMDTQIAYWNDYYTDLANLTSRTDIEGLDTFVAKFADGSEDSVNMIAALASATDAEIQVLIDKSNELDEIQAKAAEGVADLETGLTDGIVSEFESMIDGLDLGVSAASAAKSTVDAYIEQLIAGEIRAEEAASGIRNAVQSALVMPQDPMGQWLRQHTQNGYASGTTNATPGWHLVGENGPELALFGGGETVLDARDTRQALGGTSVSISVPVTVYGNTDDDTAKDIGDSVVERVLEALREAGVDARRSAYA